MKEVEFVDRAGAQGIVWPQGSSSVASLTKEERLHGMEILTGAAHRTRVAVVLGVQGKDIDEMLEYTPKKAPLKRNIDADEVGKTAVYLLSELSSGVTGETLYVDAGFNTVGL